MTKSKKYGLLTLGYLLGLLSLMASLPARLYSKAMSSDSIADGGGNCRFCS